MGEHEEVDVKKLRSAKHDEPSPEHGWRGKDLTDDEISDDDYASQFKRHDPKE